MKELLIVITMDCEKPNETGIAGVTGPPSWDESAQFIEAYAAIAAGYGFPVSFFTHPEVGIQHRDLFYRLKGSGCSISGLHLHPWKYDSQRYRQHLGHMDENSQRDILTSAIAEWTRGLDQKPLYFRPGTFSANDATFRILAELGFVGGSLSVPGRVFPDLGSVWAGCPPDPHLADPTFRIQPGRMHFANMPLTVDFSETRRRGVRCWHPDLRPDQSFHDLDAQVSAVVEQILGRNPSVPVLNIVTHNDNDYSNANDPTCRNFKSILAAIRQKTANNNIDCTGATIDEICDRVFALDPAAPPFVPV